MQEKTKAAIELAIIELNYARSELTHSPSRSEQAARAAEHIQSAMYVLAQLTSDEEERRNLALLLLATPPGLSTRLN
jgi:hypothetical protein